jgi:SAM-dependent methyltransferase
MYRGFPAKALSLLCCPKDGQPLTSALDEEYIVEGNVTCVRCAGSYAIKSGILRFLNPEDLDTASKGNLTVFSRNSLSEGFDREAELESLKDLLPTLEALSPCEGKHVLEYGCGNGRFTVRIAPVVSMLVAIDFSIEALYKVASRMEKSWNLALVQADCTRPIASPGAFDRAICTLTSNLPTRVQRLEVFRNAALALRADGKFVFSAHYFGLRARVKRSPRSGYYEEHQIFRYLSGRSELAKEARIDFRQVVCRPISVRVPFERQLRLANIIIARVLERVPIVNWMGDLLLVTAELPKPRRFDDRGGIIEASPLS